MPNSVCHGLSVATYVVSTVDGASDLVGVVRELESGRISHFESPEDLVTALSGGRSPDDPGPGGPEPGDDGLGSGYSVRVEGSAGRERALTPAQLRISYMQADGGAAA